MTPIFHFPSRSCISINEIDGLNEDNWSTGFRATSCFHVRDQKGESVCINKEKIELYSNLKNSVFSNQYVMVCKVCGAINAIFSFCE